MDAVLEASQPIAIQPMATQPTATSRATMIPTWLEKLTVSGAAFGFATTMFIFSALVLIPNSSSLMHGLEISEPIQQIVVLFFMFGLPVLAALYGIHLGGKTVFANRPHDEFD